jgi:hypothetical protein
LIRKLLLCLLALIAIGFVVSAVQNFMETPEDALARRERIEKVAEERSQKEAKNLLVSSCQVDWERAFAKSLKDPSSLDWDHRSARLGTFGKQGHEVPVVVVPYRAKNSFGATTLEHAICQFDKTTFRLVKVLQ